MNGKPADATPPEAAASDQATVDIDRAEPHPLAGLGSTIKRLPRYLVLAKGLVGDRRLSRWRKAALGAGIAYLASPIDLVPGLIPVIGQLDDLAAVLLALRFALRGLPGAAAEARLSEAGLTRADLDEDLANVRVAAKWVARRALKVSASAARTTGRLAGRAAVAGGRLAVRGGRLAAAGGEGALRAGLRSVRAARERGRPATGEGGAP